MILLFLLLAILTGGLLSTQQILNAALGVRVGSLPSAWLNHFTGILFAGILILIGFHASSFSLDGIPFFYFFGGIFGAIAIFLVNFAIPNIGAMMMTISLIAFQLFTSMILDHFGWMGGDIIPLNSSRLIGLLFILIGTGLIFPKRNKNA